MNLHDAKQLALELMRQHGLLPKWKFAFDRAVRRFGCCNERTRRITLSARLTELNDAAEVRDTILHEIAHALVGARAGHGIKWRRVAAVIGCKSERCYGDEVRQPPAKFIGRCPTCGYEIHRSQRRRISCGKCDRRFNRAHVFVWTTRERYEVNQAIRQGLADVKAGRVMPAEKFMESLRRKFGFN